MAMKNLGYIDLPEHRGNGGFDHAAVHAASGHVYVAHTANDAVDVFDPVSRRYLFSIPDLPGVAGALVSDEGELILSSNRAANTIGVFAPGPNPSVRIIDVGRGPRGPSFLKLATSPLAMLNAPKLWNRFGPVLFCRAPPVMS